MKTCTCSEAGYTGSKVDPERTRPEQPSLITIDADPYIGETPPRAFQSWLTPNPLFYVRNHFSAPSIDLSSWSLSVDGCVAHPLSLTLADIERLPKHTVPVTLECAGNNRTDLDPPVPGSRFQCGAIGTAVWAGVPLNALLARAGVRPEAVEVLFEGADSGEPEPGQAPTTYRRSLPAEVASHPDTLLAYEMNGEPLSNEHGGPARLVVPGWYGMASVKWLSSIRVIDHEFRGFFQSDRYVMHNDGSEPIPLSHIKVKSHINQPEHGEDLPLGPYMIHGVAWSGSGRVSSVEVSDDGGETWIPAAFDGPDHRYAWRQWRLRWTPPSAGHYTLMASSRDDMGNCQPSEPLWNSLGYAVNGVMRVCVDVR